MPHKDYGDKGNVPLTPQERNIKMSRRLTAKRIAAKKAAETKVPNAKTPAKRPGLFSLPGMLKEAAGFILGSKTPSKGRSKSSRGSKGSESLAERSKSSGRTNRR